jgi:hypothetical protein
MARRCATYMADNSMRAVFRWTRRGAEMLDATQPRMRWSVHGRTVDARDRGPRSTRARGAHGPSQVVPDPDRTASADAGRQGASGDAGPRSGKMCFGTLNSDASCTRRLVNLDPWLARRTSRAAGLDHVRLATCDNTEHAARAPPPAPPGPPPPAWGCTHEHYNWTFMVIGSPVGSPRRTMRRRCLCALLADHREPAPSRQHGRRRRRYRLRQARAALSTAATVATAAAVMTIDKERRRQLLDELLTVQAV